MPKIVAAVGRDELLEPVISTVDAVDIDQAAVVEEGGGHDHHREIHGAGDRHGDHYVDPLEAEDLALLTFVTPDDPALRQCRMQVDDVGHDGRPDDSRGQQDALGSGESGYEHVLSDLPAVRIRLEDLERKGGDDDADHPHDYGLEAAEPLLLEAEDREGASTRQQAGWKQRNPEEQVEAKGCTDHLGDVTGGGDDLRLDPEADRGPPRERVAASLRQIPPRGDPELCRLRLDDHRDQVGPEHHPEQEVAELGPARDVGGEVARVDVGNGGDEGRAQERPDTSQPTGVAVERPARRPVDRCLAGKRGLKRNLLLAAQAGPRLRRPRELAGYGIHQPGVFLQIAHFLVFPRLTRMLAASSGPSGWVLRPIWTITGPPKGSLPVTVSRAPGWIERSAR